MLSTTYYIRITDVSDHKLIYVSSYQHLYIQHHIECSQNTLCMFSNTYPRRIVDSLFHNNNTNSNTYAATTFTCRTPYSTSQKRYSTYFELFFLDAIQTDHIIIIKT